MSPFNVVVIDDNPTDLDLLCHIVEDVEDVKIHRFCDSQEAMQFLDSPNDIKVDLILCDWQMPGVSGYELLKSYRKINDSTPFVMVTAHTSKELVIQSREAGASGYIAKPYVSEHIIDKVRHYQSDSHN